MTKIRGDLVKKYVPKPCKNKKIKTQSQVSRCSKRKKIVVEVPKYDLNSDTMDAIDNYEESLDEVESCEECSGNESTSGDSRDAGDEDDDHLSLPTCAREISRKFYNLTTTCMDELGSFSSKDF